MRPGPSRSIRPGPARPPRPTGLSRRSRLSVAAVAAVGALALTAAGAAAQEGGGERGGTSGVGVDSGPRFGIRLVDVPSEQADDPRARQYVVDHVAPGGTVERRVEVSNETGEAVAVELYAGAATIEGGEMRFAEGRATGGLASWTRVEPAAVVLEPGERAEAQVAIAVPDDAPGGERYGVVWAEVAGEDTGSGVRAVHRVGVRVYLSVGSGAEPVTDFEIRSLTGTLDAAGDPAVEAEVVNTGRRAVDLTGELHLDEGPASLAAGPYDVAVGSTLAPGDEHTVVVPLDPDLPRGTWRAALTLRSGTVEREAEGPVELPEGSDGGERTRALGADGEATTASSATTTRGLGTGPIAASSLLTLLAVAGFLLVAWTRRRRDRDDRDRDRVTARA